MDSDVEKQIEIVKEFKIDGIEEIGEKIIGIGGYGFVTEIKLKNGKKFAAKLIKKEKLDETEHICEFKGSHIVNVHKVDNKIINGEQYSLIIMEKAILKDLTKLNHELFSNTIYNFIISPPFEGKVGDNLLRFFAYQIILGFETLDRNDYSHFDIKPDNILICRNMMLKLSDFSLLRKPEDMKVKNNTKNVKIPGGTTGYLTPEYYQNKVVPLYIAKKQDYFALGATLYKLKYMKDMLPYKKYKDNLMTAEFIIELLQRAINVIQSKTNNTDKDFVCFLCSLIKYDPNERPNFEEIYRNKWVNKNRSHLNTIYTTNYEDEEKLIMELNKSDFLLDKRKELKKSSHKYIFKRIHTK